MSASDIEYENVSEPAVGAFSVTPHDSNLLQKASRAIYVGGGGNLTVVMASGEEVQFVNVQAGSMLPIRVIQVKATGTSVTSITALV